MRPLPRNGRPPREKTRLSENRDRSGVVRLTGDVEAVMPQAYPCECALRRDAHRYEVDDSYVLWRPYLRC